jgi:hypothetical protein
MALLLSLRDYFDLIDTDGKGELEAIEIQQALCAITGAVTSL